MLLLAQGCSAGQGATSPLRLETSPAGPNTRVTLVPATYLKLNAHVKPALELPDGTVLRFDSPSVTADSAYFASPPTALLPGRHDSVSGTIRASVCENDAPVCRSLVLEL